LLIFIHNEVVDNVLWLIYAMQELQHRKTLPQLRNKDEAVFSPCRAEPRRAVTSRASRRIASPRLLAGNSYKHLDDSRMGKGHVTASAVMQQ
jgi:hypothetical protein